MGSEIKKKIKNNIERSYLNKDTAGFKNELIQYARTYFSTRIQDFSESSVGGLYLDMAAFIGDSMAFYLDHQFGELDIETAVEEKNVERLVRAAGVKIAGAAPATVDVTFYVEIPSEYDGENWIPQLSLAPTIKEGTVVSSNSGVAFELTEDLNFSLKLNNGNYIANYVVPLGGVDTSGNVTKLIGSLVGGCISGTRQVKSFNIPNTLQSFRRIILPSESVTEIISVKDSNGNEYYEVGALTQDIVYKKVLNVGDDSDLVKYNFELQPAPYRFTATMSRKTGLTTLQFGSGQEGRLDDDNIPDPSELSLPLFGKKTFSRFSIDPNSLLQTQTLGISPVNTTITVTYRSGGGLSHNVSPESIRTVTSLIIEFPLTSASDAATVVRASVDVNNITEAEGGESPLTLNELRSMVFAFRNSQSRIVTKEDLIARIYTMPSSFGRVFRVGVSPSQNNPLATVIHILSRNLDGELVISPDALKKNLQVYLNESRVITDAFDIVDAAVINIAVKYAVVVDSISNPSVVVQNVNAEIAEYFKIENFQIEQPILISDIQNIIINVSGVLSLSDFKINNLRGYISDRIYSDYGYNILSNTTRQIVNCPVGAIFELKYPDFDIIGNSV